MTTARSKRKTLLLVDDEASVREAYRMVFSGDAGVKLVAVDSSKAALVYARRTKVDLVISDIRRSGMDGLEFCRTFKRSPPATPLVLVSAVMNDRTCELARQLGADQCLTKPVGVTSLREIVGNLLERPDFWPAAHREPVRRTGVRGVLGS